MSSGCKYKERLDALPEMKMVTDGRGVNLSAKKRLDAHAMREKCGRIGEERIQMQGKAGRTICEVKI